MTVLKCSKTFVIFAERKTPGAQGREKMALASRVISERAATNLWRLPLGLLHTINYSTASTAFTASQNPTSEAANKPKSKKKKKKNLFEVAQFLPNWGIGYHMAKAHWTNVSYEITKINLYKVYPSLSVRSLVLFHWGNSSNTLQSCSTLWLLLGFL